MPTEPYKHARQITAAEVKVAWATFRLKVGAMADDFYGRSRMMEAALGMPKWSLSRSPRSYLSEGPMQAPLADPAWFDNRRDYGLKEAALVGIKQVLPSQSELWDDIYQEMVSASRGTARNDIYGWLGEKNSEGILTGRVKPQQMKGTLKSFAQKNAYRIKKNMSREVSLDAPTGDNGESSYDMSDNQVYDRWQNAGSADRMTILASILRGPDSRRFLKWLMTTLPTQAGLSAVQLKIFELDMAKVLAGQPTLPARELGALPEVYSLSRSGGVLTSQAVNKARRSWQEGLDFAMAKALRSDAQLQGWVETAMIRSHMRLGTQKTTRVVSEYLGLKEAAGFHGDANVALSSVIHNAQGKFLQDVVTAVKMYSASRTPLKGKPGGAHMSRGVAFGSMVNFAVEDENGEHPSLGVEAKVTGGKILVSLSTVEDDKEKTWRFSQNESPASIGSTVAHYGEALLLGQV